LKSKFTTVHTKSTVTYSLNDMIMNAQKFDDFLINITEHKNSVDECVEQLNILLADIFEQYIII
jgi:hypothetical protein